jgi:hypothetical protein
MSPKLWIPALVSTLMLGALVSAQAQHGFQLLSSREYSEELAAQKLPHAQFAPRAADFNAPTITVVKPDHSAPIQPPVDIEVRFAPAPGASVDLASLKIMYGFMKFDITQRILQAPGVEVSAAGLKASGAQMPSGTHKLLIQLADNLGRTARQPVEFTVK